MEELIQELISTLEEIMGIEDDKFAAASELAIQALTMSLTGTHADESLRKTVSAYKYLGFNRIEISNQNEAVKAYMYKLITEEFKTRYTSESKQEFLDKFYSLFESYSDKILVYWDLDVPEIHVQLLNEKAKMPTYANYGDQGADIYACEDIILPPHSFGTIVKTGLAMAIPTGWAIAIRPRSGMSAKTKVRVSNAPGTIDEGYRDEIGVILDNYGDEPYVIKEGDRIAQFILEKNYTANFTLTENVRDYGIDREGGFGSTGE